VRVLLLALVLTGCFTTQATRNKNTYICVKRLTELKTEPSEAIRFCERTFKEEIE
jgi:hypothetical protein